MRLRRGIALWRLDGGVLHRGADGFERDGRGGTLLLRRLVKAAGRDIKPGGGGVDCNRGGQANGPVSGAGHVRAPLA